MSLPLARPMIDQPTLRRDLKRIRAQIPPTQRAALEQAAMTRLANLPTFTRARRVAAYIGVRGELNPLPLLQQAADLGKHCYLPVLHPFLQGRLWFCRWHPGDPLRTNRFGILEPICRRDTRMRATHLDLVIVPLLGFDAHRKRIGMGGGYYDRTFAFKQRAKYIRRPRLIGIAFDAQRVAGIDANPWDVTMDAIVTESSHYTR